MGRTSASATEIPPDEETRSDSSPPVLFWAESDIEQRLGFQGGRFTRCNNLLTFLMAVLLTVVFYTALLVAQGTWIAAMFTQRGATPCFIVFFSSWSLSILFIKSRKLALQVQSLRLSIVSPDHAFILSTATVDQISTRMVEMVDDPKHFVVLNRITIALSNLRNLGRVTDVDEILRSQAEHDESSMETSYSLLRGFIWAIPVLGFIGTVLGLSQAIGGFGAVLGTSSDISQITGSLQVVTSGLATAFETTLAALVAALAIQILFTFLKKHEEEFLDNCAEYCHRHVVNRLRVMPYQQEPE
jgi:biopolymer transport protein ExbB/TolQ